MTNYPSNDTYDHELVTESLNILHLNDDCLLKIFSYLNIHELVNKLGTCQKLDEIIHINLRRSKKICLSFRCFTSTERKLLREAGKYPRSIELLVGYSVSTEIVRSALESTHKWKNLKHFTLHYVTMCDQYLQLIVNISNQLESIDFSFCQLTDELMVEFFKYHCKSLKELIIVGNYAFCGSSLIGLRNLKSLIVEEHEKFILDINEFKSNNPTVVINMYDKGRFKCNKL